MLDALNYQHLRYFWAVAREGNLTRAAAKLRITQSAVSVQLKKLEEAIGHKLFDRRGRGLELTAEGQLALDYAESIFALGTELLEALTASAKARQKKLRVGVLATLSRNFQIALLGRLLNRDDVMLTVRSGSLLELVERLERHDLDLVLSNLAPLRHERSSWVAHAIGTQPVSLIGHPRRRRSRDLARLLSREPLVLPPPESGVRIGFDAIVERLNVRPRVVAEVDDMAMLRLVAREQRGVAVIPPIVVHDELANGTLVELARLPGVLETFFAISTARRTPNPLLRELLGATG
jgi:LysR family transcriptional activator of nhaA